MTIPTLYGSTYGTEHLLSRALRSIWALEEIGIDYKHVPTRWAGGSKTPEYLAINPNGRIPALVDGPTVLHESMAINLYLAKRYGGDLYRRDAASEAKVWQWSTWVMTEIEPHQMQVVFQRFFVPEAHRSTGVVAAALASLQRPLRVLEAHLSDRSHLIDRDFCIADLNVAGPMSYLGAVGMDLSEFPNVVRWLAACHGRPPYAAACARP